MKEKCKILNIKYLYKILKTRIFPSKSRLADFHSILALFQRIIMPNFYADSLHNTIFTTLF